MSATKIDDRQVLNRAALTHIGTPANETLDVIFSTLDSIISGLSGSGSPYVAKEVALSSGTTSYAVTISSQPDTSYVPFAIMENLTDSNPQIQPVIITNKTTTGFTVQWNAPLSSSNYVLSYIVPYKVWPEMENGIAGSSTSISPLLTLPQNGSSYGIIGVLQNDVDTNPQFQPALITAQSSTQFTLSWNAPTSSASYIATTMLNATGVVSFPLGSTSTTINLSINYNTSGYGVIVAMKNTTDSLPQFQPLLITSKSGTSFTVSWSDPTLSSNYSLYYYVISLTP